MAIPRQGQKVEVGLQFFPSLSAGPFPFPQRFVVMLVDPDNQCNIDRRIVDFHVSCPTRFTDRNINPLPETASWTGGITNTFTREDVATKGGNKNHMIFKVV